jgi:hypothetical protein
MTTETTGISTPEDALRRVLAAAERYVVNYTSVAGFIVRDRGELEATIDQVLQEQEVAVLEALPCCFAYVREFVVEIEAESWFPSLPDPPGACPCPRCGDLAKAREVAG